MISGLSSSEVWLPDDERPLPGCRGVSALDASWQRYVGTSHGKCIGGSFPLDGRDPSALDEQTSVDDDDKMFSTLCDFRAMSTGRSSDSSCSRTFSTALFILPTTQHVLLQISPVTIIRYVSAGTLLWESGADPETVGERMGSLGRSSSVQGQSPSWKIWGKASRKLTTVVYLTLKNTKQLWSVCGLNSLLLHPLCTTNDADEKTHFLGGGGLNPLPRPHPL